LTVLPSFVRFPVGVVVERRKATSPWVEFLWRSIAVLDGIPDAQPWTPLDIAPDATTFFAGTSDIELYRAAADNYRFNLLSGAASLWVALDATDGDPPYKITTVTADPAEGESLTESGQGIVDAVPMTDAIRDVMTAFVAQHYVEHPFKKRQRNRADPEALARRPRRGGNDDER
jgi:hypothetical protein